jgi:hypothetical protein
VLWGYFNSDAADSQCVTSARESAGVHPLPCFHEFSEGRTLRNSLRQLASFNKLGQDVIVMSDTIEIRTLKLRELIAAKFRIRTGNSRDGL